MPWHGLNWLQTRNLVYHKDIPSVVICVWFHPVLFLEADGTVRKCVVGAWGVSGCFLPWRS